MEAVACRQEGGQAGRNAYRMIRFAIEKNRREVARQHHKQGLRRPPPSESERSWLLRPHDRDGSAESAFAITRRPQRGTIIAPRERASRPLATHPENQRF